jgi:type VI secretion system secreted protein VgrG
LQKIDDLPKGHNHDALEIYEWHGRYPDLAEGAQLARVRREEQQQDFQRITASSNVRGIMPGYYFKLTDHPVASNNAEYLIIGATYHFQENQQTDDSKETEWSVGFTAKPSSERYQPPRVITKTPVVGPHTAKVTGPAGSEIWCDAYGRVKVQFAWDRYGKNDENSSCWIRVSSPWAGSNFGGMHVPRVGQEVMVEFVGGDGDQPLITGRVYNQNQMPPWDLPANATQSGFLSRSSPGGAYGNANAIRFEDKKGAEQVWIQAERNMDTVVEHDETHHVMHDRTKTIDHDETVFVHHDRTETVDNNETITVHNNRKERVDQNEVISIGVDRTEDVGANETLKVGANRTETIVTVSGAKAETVTLAKAESIGLAKALTVGGAYQVSVGAAMNTTVGLAQAEEVGLEKITKVGTEYKIGVGAKYVLEAGAEIVFKTGDASITLKADGSIVLHGTNLQMIGDNIALKADSVIKLKASKIDDN